MWNKIYDYGARLGFDDLALIEAQGLWDLEGVFLERKRRGRELSIEEKDHFLRLDPNRSLKGCRSIIVAFWQIPFQLEIEPWRKGKGSLASISWDQDYHKVLNQKLNHLDEYLAQILDDSYQSHIQVDTGPLYERGIALATGRGYQGRNAAFIHRDLGSFVVIGLLLINQEIAGAQSQGLGLDSCGDCRACLEACPGQAIGDKGIDPNRCRSWISQKKEDLEDWEKHILGDSIYGCDICQRVCPKNRGIEPKAPGPQAIKSIDIDGLHDLSNREFRRKYGHLSGSWRGAKIWKRNGRIIHSNFLRNGIL